jgi:Fe-S-cluster containining protein
VKPRHAEGYRAISEVYDMVPEVACRGLCHNTCTSVDATALEREAIQDRHGIDLGPAIPSAQLRRLDDRGELPRCAALSAVNTCRVYADRPLICRLYGAEESLPCEHGCLPVNRGFLTTETGTDMIRSVEAISDEYSRPAPRRERRRRRH